MTQKYLLWALAIGLLLTPVSVFASVVINEVAWMGAADFSANEWIELYNGGPDNIDLTGWILEWKDGVNKFVFNSEKCKNLFLNSGEYFLLERTDDDSAPAAPADCIYTGALSNSGERLVLKNNNSFAIDEVNASVQWPAGDNATKETMQKSDADWITAIATPKAKNYDQHQDVASPSAGPAASQSQLTESFVSSAESISNDLYLSPEKIPKIKAYAGENKTAVVGAEIEFRGQAFGLKNEPLDNARFLWTFGDGFTKEGQNIIHSYQYVGDYIAVLNVSSGQYSASDSLLTKVVPNKVFISEIKTGEAGWVELENQSSEEIDISGMQIKTGSQVFALPKSSRIGPGAHIVIPTSSNGFVVAPGKGSAELRYSGGFMADNFSYDGFPGIGETFNRDGEKAFIGWETPGQKNKIVVGDLNAGVKINNPVGAVPTSSSFSIAQKKVLPAGDKKENSKQNTLEQIAEETNADQTANVITANKDGESKNNAKTYLFLVAGLIVFSAVAIIFIRRGGNYMTNN